MNQNDIISEEAIDRRAQAISDRWPLVFDPESDWGWGTLEAIAVIDIVAERDTKGVYRGTLENRRLQIKLMIEALQTYEQELGEPTCYYCGVTLTDTTTDCFGQPTHCPTCNKTQDVKR